MANTNNPRGFKPHGGGHFLCRGTLGGTVTKGDPLALNASRQLVLFAAATYGRVFAIANESGVSGDEIGIILVRPGDVFEVQSNLTYAVASHLFGDYDVAGSTGGVYLDTTTTYGHAKIVGVHPSLSVSAPDATGAYVNALVQFNLVPADQQTPRMAREEKVVATCTGTYTCSNVLPVNVYVLDPGGSARDVTLPTGFKGRKITIVNAADAAEALTIKDSEGSTIATAGQNEVAVCHHDGSAWTAYGLGLAAV